MSSLLKIPNFSESIIVEKSYLDEDTLAGPDALLKNAAGMAVNQYALFGNLGQEQAELCKISSISAETLTVAPSLIFDHSIYTEVTALRTNQIKIYHATNTDGSVPADGDFSLLATVNMDLDNVETTYNDSSGGPGYWYKFTYFNSVTSFETDIADSIASRGQADHYTSIQAIRRAAGMDDNIFIADGVIADKRDAAEDEVNSMLGGTYTIPFAEPIPATIREIVEQIAAGLILTDEYGVFASGTSKDGDAKLKAARDRLTILKTQGSELLGSSGQSLVVAGRSSGWPLDSTELTRPESNGSTRKFRMEDRY